MTIAAGGAGPQSARMTALTDDSYLSPVPMPGIDDTGLPLPTVPDTPDPTLNAHWLSSEWITWSFETLGNIVSQPSTTFSRPMVEGEFQELTREALTMWASVCGVHFLQVPDDASVDMRIGWEALGTPLGGHPIGLTGWTGSTNGVWLPGITVGVEDPSENLVTKLVDGDYNYAGWDSRFFQIMAHEIGHGLGLDHNNQDDAALMNSVAQHANRSINQSDLTTVDSIYGLPAAGITGLVVTNPGPHNFQVDSESSITPFTTWSATDMLGLTETIKVIVLGNGSISDPIGMGGSDWSFAGRTFTETFNNLGPGGELTQVLNRLIYTAATPGEAELDVEVTDSLGRDFLDKATVINRLTPPNPSGVSVEGTAIITDGPALIGQNGFMWRIHNGVVSVNGIDDLTSGRVVALQMHNGQVWQENADRSWWAKTLPTDDWSPAPGTQTPPIGPVTLTVSVNNTVLDNEHQAIVDANQHTWSITQNNQVDVDGVVDLTTRGVIRMAYENGQVWQENDQF